MKLTDLVEDVLKNNWMARDSDRELLLDVWERLGFYLTNEQREQFRELPSTESIRRVRQKIQERGLYTASPNIKAERDWRSLRMQQITPKATPKYIEQVIEPEEQVELFKEAFKKEMPR